MGGLHQTWDTIGYRKRTEAGRRRLETKREKATNKNGEKRSREREKMKKKEARSKTLPRTNKQKEEDDLQHFRHRTQAARNARTKQTPPVCTLILLRFCVFRLNATFLVIFVVLP